MDETRRYVKGIILAWEKLRVVYNVVLLVDYLVCSLPLWGAFWFQSFAFFAVVANAFYCFGPLLETYACVVLGRRIGRARYLLFGAGLVLSTGVVVTLSRLSP